MELEGIHHVTAITGDAPSNVKFYAGLLGLRLVKKTVNQDDPTVYHLFYADEQGSPGADLTFFEYPGAPKGRAGDGMVHRIVWRVVSEEALDFWKRRLESADVRTTRREGSLRFTDPEGIDLGLRTASTSDESLIADHPDVPSALALQGFDSVRAYSANPEASTKLLENVLNFERRVDGAWEARGAKRGSYYHYDEPPSERGFGGAGTVHHVAWASPQEEHQAWHDRLTKGGARPTPIIDRFYFKSIYFREPSGVLFEIATIGPGFSMDEPAGSLGERLSLPPTFEAMRSQLEQILTRLPSPR